MPTPEIEQYGEEYDAMEIVTCPLPLPPETTGTKSSPTYAPVGVVTDNAAWLDLAVTVTVCEACALL